MASGDRGGNIWDVATDEQSKWNVESIRRSLAPLGTLLWVMAVGLAFGGAVGSIWVARIAHPIQGAPSQPAPIAPPIPTVPSESVPTGVTHPYVTLGIAIVFGAVIVAAAVAAVAWAIRHAESPRQYHA